jgi:hypothetical protein
MPHWSQSRSGQGKKWKNFLFLSGNEPRFLGSPAHIPDAIPALFIYLNTISQLNNFTRPNNVVGVNTRTKLDGSGYEKEGMPN